MDPFTLFVMAVGTGLGKLGKAYAGSHAAQLSAEIRRGNADLMRRQADALLLGQDVAQAKGLFEQRRLDDKLKRVLSGQYAYHSSQGLDPLAASPLLLAEAASSQGAVDRGLIGARVKAEQADIMTNVANIYGKAAGETGGANALEAKAAADRLAGFFGAGTALLSGGAKRWGGLTGGADGKEPNTFWASQSFFDSPDDNWNLGI